MGVKRRRKSALSNTQLTEDDADKVQISGPSITDLPSAIIVDIVLKLPTKTIVMCKSVNKTWHGLISDPLFAKLHFARSKTCTLIRNNHSTKFSRSLFLLEPEDFSCTDSGYWLCRAGNGQLCLHCRTWNTVRARLKIPLRNPQVMLERLENRRNPVAFCVATRSKSKHLIKMESPLDHRHDVVNSCNGLLCLSKSRLIGERDKSNAIVVCNPVTAEFVHLPENCDYNRGGRFEFALGFSPKHDRYKVIRLFNTARLDSLSGLFRLCVSRAEIHTLGTDSWRSIDVTGLELGLLRSPSYLDGALHWIFNDANRHYKLASFDLDEEIFRVHSVPWPPARCHWNFHELALTVLGGHLYLYTDLVVTHIFIWMMSGSSVSRSWTELFSVDVSELRCFRRRDRYQLLSCFNDEAILMFCSRQKDFVYYDRVRGVTFKRLKFQWLASELEAISYTPSFVSLRDVLMQSNVEVLNISSGCGKIKLVEETHPLLFGGGIN